MNDIEGVILSMELSDGVAEYLDRKEREIILQALKEKLERENPQPLITDKEGDIMLCNHCGTDLMGEFSEPLEEKYCPFCGWAIDLRKTVCEPKHIGEANEMVAGDANE